MRRQGRLSDAAISTLRVLNVLGHSSPECTVNGSKPGPRSSVNEARELVTQGNILGDEICAILENGGDNGENQWELEGHPPDCSVSRNERKSQQFRYRVQ
jgi:hypothetical protein